MYHRQDGLHYVERYSSASNQWVEKALLSNQRFAFGAAYINEGVYAIGGLIYCNDTLSDDCGARWARNYLQPALSKVCSLIPSEEWTGAARPGCHCRGETRLRQQLVRGLHTGLG